jgi:6-phosphogluconolactonase
MLLFRSFSSQEKLTQHLADMLKSYLQKPGQIMLSGGSTPYKTYNQLAKQPLQVHPECQLFLSDERYVPSSSPKNNAHNLQSMLKGLQCASQFIPVRTELNAETATEQFAKEIEPFQQPALGLLGIGSDGHTAGIFSAEHAHNTSPQTALHTDRPDGLHGISVSATFIHRIQRILLIATGENKREILTTLQHQPETIPTGIILQHHPQTEVWTDLTFSS